MIYTAEKGRKMLINPPNEREYLFTVSEPPIIHGGEPIIVAALFIENSKIDFEGDVTPMAQVLFRHLIQTCNEQLAKLVDVKLVKEQERGLTKDQLRTRLAQRKLSRDCEAATNDLLEFIGDPIIENEFKGILND